MADTFRSLSFIPGWNIIQDSRSHPVRRVMWLLFVVICLSLILVHGGGLLMRFRTYPTWIQLTVADRRGSALPALTVCPLDRFDLARLERLWREEMMMMRETDGMTLPAMPDAREQYYQLAERMRIEELWRQIAYQNPSDLFPMCFIGRGTDCSSAGKFQAIWTPAGACYTYWSQRKTLSGHFHGLYLRLNVSHLLGPSTNESGWKISVHEPGVSPLLTSSRHYYEIGIYSRSTDTQVDGYSSSGNRTNEGSVQSQFVNIRLIPKEFIQVNHPRKPCSQDKVAQAECEINCFEAAVINTTHCKLPYMRTNLVPYCNTSEGVRQTEELVQQLLVESLSSFQCGCMEPCNKIIYKYQSESLVVNMDYGRIKLFYDTTIWSTVREVFAYSWIELLCDAGNSLCLLLGASVLCLLEIIEQVLYKMLSFWIAKGTAHYPTI